MISPVPFMNKSLAALNTPFPSVFIWLCVYTECAQLGYTSEPYILFS